AGPFGAEPGELEQPCALGGAQQELASLEVGVARRPVRLAPVAERAPAPAGELLERLLCGPDDVGEPAVQPVLGATRRVDQEIAQLDRVRPGLRPAVAVPGTRARRQRTAMAREEMDAARRHALVLEEVGDRAERAAGQARPLVDQRERGRTVAEQLGCDLRG